MRPRCAEALHYLSSGPTPLRVIIIGVPGSGKTTLARCLASNLGIESIEADKVFWIDAKRSREREEFRALVGRECDKREAFVLEGHFKTLKGIALQCATHVVFLDCPGWLAALRLLKRQIISRGQVPGGSRALWFSLVNLRRLRVEQLRAVDEIRGTGRIRVLRLSQGVLR